MLLWVIAVLAAGLAAAAGLYGFLRLRPAINSLRAEVSRMRGRLDAELDEVQGWRNDERRLSRTLERQQGELNKSASLIGKLESQVVAERARVAALANAQAEAGQTSANLSAAVAAIEDAAAMDPSANAKRALSHRRLLSEEAAREFLDVVGPKLGLELKERHLYHLAHRICVLENRCHGRLATTVDAMMTRTLAALHLTRSAGDRFRLAEIGTLYGIGAIALYDAVRFNVSDPHLTLIDPLDGYYATSHSDFTSATPVIKDVLVENLRLAGASIEQVLIVQAKSESEEALAATAKREFDMLVIDGDHSYDGVKRDFENYFPHVRLGGIVVIDDYGVEEWPAIKKYADEKLLPRTDLQAVFAGHRTLLLRKI